MSQGDVWQIKDLQADKAQLREALQAIIRAWHEPGPMGTIYAMIRAVGEAESVLAEIST